MRTVYFLSCNRPDTVSWIWGRSLTAWSWSQYQSGPSVPTGNRPAWHLQRGRVTLRQQSEAHEWDRGTERATQKFLSVARAVRPLKSQMMMNERDQPVGKSPPGCHHPATPLSILIPLLKGFSSQIFTSRCIPIPDTALRYTLIVLMIWCQKLNYCIWW